jgi:PAS domain S-box-containing protein
MTQGREGQIAQLRAELEIAQGRLKAEILAREQAEQTLVAVNAQRKGELDFRQRCIEIANVMLLGLDAAGHVTLINPRGLEILGCPRREDVLGKDWFAHFLPARQREPALRVFQQLLRGQLEGTEHYENPILCSEGQERIVAWHNGLLRDASGHITGILCSGQDVTATRRAENALRTREQQQAAVAMLGQRALASTDLQSLLDLATGTVAEVLGVEYCKVLELRPNGVDFLLRSGVGWRPGLVGCATVTGGRDSQAGYTLVSQAPVIVEDLGTETRFHGPKLLADHHVVSGLSCAITGPGGGPWGILGAHTREHRRFSRDDIHLLVAVANTLAAVIERIEATRVLREREADLRRAQALGHLGSWRIDVRGNQLTWSEETHRIFGVPKGAPMTYDTFLDVVHPDDRDYVNAMWQAALRGKAYDIEHRLLVGDQVKWVRERAELEFATDGSLLGAFGTAQDITERKQHEQARQEADRHKDEFLAMLAHELRNPLTPIVNAAQVLAMLDLEEPHVRWAQEIIARQATHLTRLVDDLLDVSRIARGKITLKMEPVELGTIARQSAEGVQGAAQAKDLRLELRLPQAPIHLRGDPVRLVQVLVNTLDNAAKYSPNGAVVELTAEVQGKEAVIQVRDQGRGIPPALLPRVFDLFQQGERPPDRPDSGLGIGLTLVRRLVELHGGAVTVESPGVGRGTTVTVRLPLDPTADGATAPASPPPPGPAATTRILVVDDDPSVAQSMALLFRTMGHEVRVVSRGEDAVPDVLAFRPQLVVLDLGLPGMNGWDTARALRQLPDGHDLRLVAVTGYGDEEARRRSRAAGFDMHLIKPVLADQLAALFSQETEPGRAPRVEA